MPKAGASLYNSPQCQGPGEDQIMDERLAHDPILIRFGAVLDGIYGARLERVVLYGSRARGEARPDSDDDVAVFLRSLPDRWRELDAWPICASASSTTPERFSMPSLCRSGVPGRHAADAGNPP